MISTKTWPRQPFIGLAFAAVVGIAFAERWPHPVAGIICAGILAIICLTRGSSLATYLLAAASFFALHSARTTSSPGIRLARELGPEPAALAARGTVESEPQISARGVSSFRFRLHSIERNGVAKATDATMLARWRGDVRYGDELQLFGVVAPPEPPRNPGEFDMRAYLLRQDVRRILIVRYPENGRTLNRDRGSPIKRAALKSRAWMQASLALGLEDSPELHGLISGMVLGARDETPDEIEEQFQQTGTLHLFAVSGLNVAIIAQLLWVIALALRLPRKWAIGVVIPALFFYALVTGLNASSIRAALMAAFLLGGFFVERKVFAANSLAAAAVTVLLFDTNQLYSPGFQLSFAVVLAIFLCAKPIFHFLLRCGEPDPFLPKSLLNLPQRLWQKCWGAFSGGTSVSLAAWIGSLPLILPYFYLITPVSLLANLIVVPLAFFVLAFGLMSLLVIPIAPWLAIIFNNANWILAATILWVVGIFARLPASHIYLERPHWPTGARVEVTALDLGAGAAIHVRDRHRDWLIDCGAERNFRRMVRGYLRSRGVNRLDGLILTHGDAAHIGAAAHVQRAFYPIQIIDLAAPDRSLAHRALIAKFQEQQIARKLCAAPDELELSSRVKAKILFPPAEFKADKSDDQAMVVQLLVDNRWRVLLTSDSGKATERALIAQEADLRSDILVKGQHYSGVSASEEFLERVRPKAIVASASERLDAEWARKVEEKRIKLFRQEETGAVTLRFFREHWEVIPYRTKNRVTFPE